MDFDVRPKIEVKDYTGLAAEVESEEIPKDAVERQLEMIRNANAKFRGSRETQGL